jgi:hypothetical protein
MGVYIYSVRTKNVTAVVEGKTETIFALNFLARSGPDHHGWEPESRYNRRAIGAAESTWERRGVKDLTGTLVYLAGDDDKPRDGNAVIRYPHKGPCMYDTETFGEPVGYLRKTRKGRRVVWTVVPAVWTVKFTKPGKPNHYVSNETLFSAGEAVEYAKTVPVGCYAKVELARVAKTVYDRIAAPESNDPDVTKIKTILLSGPWPTSMWERAGLSSTADAMLAEGELCFYRDTEEAGGELNYRLTNWVNLVEKAAEGLGAPGAAVDLDFEGDKVVCTVATVGRFVGRNAYDVACKMDYARQTGRKFSLDFSLTLASDDPRLYAKVEQDRVVFAGGKHGKHSLCLDVSSDERILVHWRGYCENNGAQAV